MLLRERPDFSGRDARGGPAPRGTGPEPSRAGSPRHGWAALAAGPAEALAGGGHAFQQLSENRPAAHEEMRPGGGRRGRRSQQGRDAARQGSAVLPRPPALSPPGSQTFGGGAGTALRPPGQSKAPVAPETVRPSAAAPWAGSPAPGLSFPFCSVRVSLSPRLGCTHPGTECRAHSGLPGAKAEEGNAAPTAVSQPTSEGPGALGSSV